MYRILSAAIALTLLGGCSDRGGEPSHKIEPAHVDNPVTEAGLTRVALTEEAAQRLGIETRPITLRAAGASRTVGGEIIVPPGRSIVVSAPVAGRLLPLPDGGTPRAGSPLSAGQPVFRLVALPTEDGLLSTQEAVAVAEAQLENAHQKADRAERLYRDGVGSLMAHEDAQAALAAAEAAALAAQARLDLVSGLEVSADAELSALLLRSPETGRILRVLAGVGQTVSAGTPLFEVGTTDPLWVRVAVYAGDLAKIDRTGPGRVTDLGRDPASGRSADPVEGPPTANRDAATVDLYYRLPNGDGRHRPGERVAVTVPLRGERESLVVASSALIRDVHGGSWVYEALGDHAFARRRVEVLHAVGDETVLARGPAAGTEVVTVGVAELYGTEFGAAH